VTGLSARSAEPCLNVSGQTFKVVGVEQVGFLLVIAKEVERLVIPRRPGHLDERFDLALGLGRLHPAPEGVALPKPPGLEHRNLGRVAHA